MSVLTTSHTGNGRSIASDDDSSNKPTFGVTNVRTRPANSLHPEQLDAPATQKPVHNRRWTRECKVVSGAFRALLATLLTLSILKLASAGPQVHQWSKGPQSRRALESTISIALDGSPLRKTLIKVGNTQSVSVFVDRRIDPSLELKIAAQSQPLGEVIRDMAHQFNLGVGYVGPVVYVGPPLTAARISTLGEMKTQQAKELSPKLRSKLLKREKLEWPRLSEPRWIVRQLCAEANLGLPDAGLIPHDLWDAGDYPKMLLSERLTLVLAGFGLTYTVDEKKRQLTLKGIPKAVALERVYETKDDVDSVISQMTEDYPGAFIRGSARELRVRATVEDHWAISETLQPSKSAPKTDTPKAGAGKQVYTLNVKQQPLDVLLKKIAKQLGMKIEFTKAAKAQAGQRVSFEVTNATLGELFEAAVSPAHLTATVDEESKTVKIQ